MTLACSSVAALHAVFMRADRRRATSTSPAQFDFAP